MNVVFNNLLAGLIILDKKAKIEAVNQSMAKEPGKKSGEMEGCNINEFLDDEDTQNLLSEYLHYCIQKKIYIIVEMLNKKN